MPISFFESPDRMNKWMPMSKPTLIIGMYICGIIILTIFSYIFQHIAVYLFYLFIVSILVIFLIYEIHNGIYYYYGFEKKLFNGTPSSIADKIGKILKNEHIHYSKYERKDFINRNLIRTIYHLNNNVRIVLINIMGIVSIGPKTRDNIKLIESLKEKIDNNLLKYETR